MDYVISFINMYASIHISLFIYILAWEPIVAQGNHRYSRRLPALGRKL